MSTQNEPSRILLFYLLLSSSTVHERYNPHYRSGHYVGVQAYSSPPFVTLREKLQNQLRQQQRLREQQQQEMFRQNRLKQYNHHSFLANPYHVTTTTTAPATTTATTTTIPAPTPTPVVTTTVAPLLNLIKQDNSSILFTSTAATTPHSPAVGNSTLHSHPAKLQASQATTAGHGKRTNKGKSQQHPTAGHAHQKKKTVLEREDAQEPIDQLQVQSGEGGGVGSEKEQSNQPGAESSLEERIKTVVTELPSIATINGGTSTSVEGLPLVVPSSAEREDVVSGQSSLPVDSVEAQMGKSKGYRGGGGGARLGGGAYGEHHGLPLTPLESSIASMLRCQDLDTREMIPAATACRNTRSDKVCAYLFMEVDLRTGKRDVKCNLQGLEDIAESCRRTCGICCEDINYSCEDDNNGIIDCARQLDKCHVSKWFGVLSRFCAGSCGLCARTTCRDYDNTCRVRKPLCLKEETVDYMRENCARTCGFCVVGDLYPGAADPALSELMNGIAVGTPETMARGVSSMATLTSPMAAATYSSRSHLSPPIEKGVGNEPSFPSIACQDSPYANCSQNEEMCANPLYSEYMLKYCAKTCLKCDQQPQPQQTASQAGAGDNSAHVRHRHPNIEGVGHRGSVPATATEVFGAGPMLDEAVAVIGAAAVINSAAGKQHSSGLRPVEHGYVGGGIRKCVDRHVNCRRWAGKGLCGVTNSTITPTASEKEGNISGNKDRRKQLRRLLCPKSCKLC